MFNIISTNIYTYLNPANIELCAYSLLLLIIQLLSFYCFLVVETELIEFNFHTEIKINYHLNKFVPQSNLKFFL